MPGKINPTQSEALTQVAVQVFGCDAAVAFAGSQGNFQLNVYKPVILDNVLTSATLLAEAIRSFDRNCAVGIEPNLPRIRQHLDDSLMLVTALNPHIGYERSAEIALHAHRTGVHRCGRPRSSSAYVTDAEFDAWVDPSAMTHPLTEA